jgi:predicted HTH domain antitoxin
MELEGAVTTMNLELPEEVFSALRQPPGEFLRQMRFAAAALWYSRGEISQEKAALIAGMDRTDFLNALAKREIDVIVADMDDLQKELDRG